MVFLGNLGEILVYLRVFLMILCIIDYILSLTLLFRKFGIVENCALFEVPIVSLKSLCFLNKSKLKNVLLPNIRRLFCFVICVFVFFLSVTL